MIKGFVKASERKPDKGKDVVVRNFVMNTVFKEKNMGHINGFGVAIGQEMKYENCEWLDESEEEAREKPYDVILHDKLQECLNRGVKDHEEIEELKAWKESAMSVMPPMQEIGKALGVRLGESIHDKILPGIEYWKQRCEAAENLSKLYGDWQDFITSEAIL